MNKLILLLGLIISSTSVANDGLAPCLTLVAIDAAQTLDIKNNSERYETNKFMGRHPSDSTVRSYFAGVFSVYSLIDSFAPDNLRKAATIFCISTHGSAIENNIRLNIGVSF